MSGRLGQFYALVLLLACLVTNIAFFAEVREPFLGDDDPMASVKSAFSDLNIQARVAEFSPKILSRADGVKVDEAKIDGIKIDEMPEMIPPTPPAPLAVERPAPRVVEPPAPREPRQQPTPPVNNLLAEPVIAEPIGDPFPPLETEPPKELEEPKPAVSTVVQARNETTRNETAQQAAAIIPVSAPAPVTAATQPVIADRFNPITVEPPVPPPTAPARPSSTPVWDTIDTILERPIRYD